MITVYIAGPYASGPALREGLLGRLAAIGVGATSRWLETATAPEDFSKLTPDDIRQVAASNDADLRRSDVVLLVDPEGKGRETYAEVARALEWGKPVIWCGRPNLSAWRRDVTMVDGIDQALRILKAMSAVRIAQSELEAAKVVAGRVSS